MNFNKRCISKEEFKKYEDSDVAYALYVRDNLKPNDYFRTFDGQIFKSINVSPIKGNEIYYANGDYTWADISAVDKFSDNPIDLIEVGDYINEEKIIEIRVPEVEIISPDEYTADEQITVCIFKCGKGAYYRNIKEEEITSILTHEQYYQHAYRK